MNIEQLLKLINLCTPEHQCSSDKNEKGLIKIVILQRGWVVVGEFYQNGNNCKIENGFVIRRWGTTRGLGELALEGKKSETVLDKIPTTEFHQLTIVASILCDQNKWK